MVLFESLLRPPDSAHYARVQVRQPTHIIEDSPAQTGWHGSAQTGPLSR